MYTYASDFQSECDRYISVESHNEFKREWISVYHSLTHATGC